MNNQKEISILDTTLRDGQQCPGAGMSFENNIKFAHMLAQAMTSGNHIIEAGFPSASNTDFLIVKEISDQLSGYNSPKVAGLCQMVESQVVKTIRALENGIKYGKSRLHTYFPVDPILAKASVGLEFGNYKAMKEKIEITYKMCKLAKDSGLEVQFSPEGYSRLKNINNMGIFMDNFDFTTDLITAAIEGGATIINCPDTIGGACFLQGEDYFINWIKKHSDIFSSRYNNISWSIHCHNDLGQAVTNSLNGIIFGPVSQIEGTINGVGERAGNANLQEILMNIKLFGKSNGISVDFDISKLKELSDFVAKNMLPRQPNSPITGDNAFKHTSGGHVNAIQENPTVYHPFDPNRVGGEIGFLFGPLSGSNHVKNIISQNGYICEDNEKVNIMNFVKDFYSDRRKGITDQEVMVAYMHYRSPIKVENISYSKSKDMATISIEGKFFDEDGLNYSKYGKNSALAALKEIIDTKISGFEIISSTCESRGNSSDALSIHTIVISNGQQFNGLGEDSDIEIAALKALINAYNSAYIEKNFKL